MGYAPKSLEVVRLNELHHDSRCSTTELRVLGVEAGIRIHYYSGQLYCAASEAPNLVKIGREFAQRQVAALGPKFRDLRARRFQQKKKEAARA